MKRLLKILAALLALGGTLPAMAADQNPPATTKKAPAPIAFPYYSSGWYFGIGSFASATNPTVDGAAVSGVQALGASIGGVGGYRWAGTNFSVDVEGSAFYNNVGGSSACQAGTCNVGAKFSSIERVKVGTDTNTITALFPNLGLPSLPGLPAQIQANVSDQRAYIFGGFDIDDVSASAGLAAGRAWQVSPGVGAGIEAALKNGSAVDVWAGYFNPTDGFHIGPSQVSQGRKLLFGVNWLF